VQRPPFPAVLARIKQRNRPPETNREQPVDGIYKLSNADTIFALSSGAPPSAIAIIRISGPTAFSALEQLAGRLPEPRRASLAKLRNPANGDLLDEALVLTFPGPGSASGEDLVELHLHGGRAVIRALEDALSGMVGLRPAQAGEFTRRAFANGQIDLNQADALGDLLSAESEWQRKAAAIMLGGRFGAAIEDWREEILRISALVEAELDFSDEDDVEGNENRNITNSCHDLADEMLALLEQPAAEKLRDGLYVVLGGPPNSGKSTLLNALVDREAAIVSDIAGTTRDVIEVPVSLDGIPLVLADTAGLRDDSGDEIEAIGMERATNAFARADMVLWLGRQGEGPDHAALIEIDAKADLEGRPDKSGDIAVSAKTGAGLSELIAAIADRARQMLPPPDSFAVNQRQRSFLQDCVDALTSADESADLLIVGECLRRARQAMDGLTGRTHTEDMLDALFGRFCIGK